MSSLAVVCAPHAPPSHVLIVVRPRPAVSACLQRQTTDARHTIANVDSPGCGTANSRREHGESLHLNWVQDNSSPELIDPSGSSEGLAGGRHTDLSAFGAELHNRLLEVMPVPSQRQAVAEQYQRTSLS